MTRTKSYHRLDCFAAVARPPGDCDSILPAPRVFDLVRLVEHADCAGEYGAIEWLVCFFESPLSVDEQDFAKELDRFTAWGTRHVIPQCDA